MRNYSGNAGRRMAAPILPGGFSARAFSSLSQSIRKRYYLYSSLQCASESKVAARGVHGTPDLPQMLG